MIGPRPLVLLLFAVSVIGWAGAERSKGFWKRLFGG
jgi:hypothetical protein